MSDFTKMETIFITNLLSRARVAEQAGVDRIMVDLETLGKEQRQGHLDTIISQHDLADVERLRLNLSTAALMVRVNPIHARSGDEINAVVAAGAEIIMLPMFTYPGEVAEFIAMLRGRAKTCLLFETGAALANIHHVLNLDGIDEAYIGLNDLHLSLGLKFMFEPLAGGLVDYMAEAFHRRNVKFGIGGIARLGSGTVPAELILSEHVRLGSSRVILSRDYWKIFDENPEEASLAAFKKEMRRYREHLEYLEGLTREELLSNSRMVKEAVSRVVANRIGSPSGICADTGTDKSPAVGKAPVYAGARGSARCIPDFL